jgi:hypothetical protein
MTPESALPDASPRSLLLIQMNEGQQEAQKHQQSDSPNEQSGTEIMITNRSRQGVSLPETVVRCVEFAIRPGISGSQCRRPRVLQPCGHIPIMDRYGRRSLSSPHAAAPLPSTMAI